MVERNYRLHKSFIPQSINFVERSQILEKLVSYMALKHVLVKLKPDLETNYEYDKYLQNINGINSFTDFYDYFEKKGLSQTEITHRIKRLKFFKLVDDELYIIPEIKLISEDRIQFISVNFNNNNNIKIKSIDLQNETKSIINVENIQKIKSIEINKISETHLKQGITEFVKILKHSGFEIQNSDKLQTILSGNGFLIFFNHSLMNISLKIEKNNSINNECIIYPKNKMGHYNHIILHSFGEFHYIMKLSKFTFDKKNSNKLLKIYTKNNIKIILKWNNGYTKIDINL